VPCQVICMQSLELASSNVVFEADRKLCRGSCGTQYVAPMGSKKFATSESLHRLIAVCPCLAFCCRACEALMQSFGISGSGASRRRQYSTIILLDEIDMLMTRDQAVSDTTDPHAHICTRASHPTCSML
jgi:hypothetical protein